MKRRLDTVQAMKPSWCVLFLALGSARGCVRTPRTAMKNIYFGTFDLLSRRCHGESWHRSLCVAETSRLARPVTLRSADQSDSVQLSSGVGGWFPGGVLLIRTGRWRDVLSDSDTLCCNTVVRMFSRNDVAVNESSRFCGVYCSILFLFFLMIFFSLQTLFF